MKAFIVPVILILCAATLHLMNRSNAAKRNAIKASDANTPEYLCVPAAELSQEFPFKSGNDTEYDRGFNDALEAFALLQAERVITNLVAPPGERLDPLRYGELFDILRERNNIPKPEVTP